MSVNKIVVAGFGLRVDLTPEVFEKESTLPFRQHVWDSFTKEEKEYYPDGFGDVFHEDYFEVDAFSDSFPALQFEWCGNPFYPSVPKTDQWFVFAKSSIVKLRNEAQWADLSSYSQISKEAFQQFELFDSLLLEEKTPRWYLFTALS